MTTLRGQVAIVTGGASGIGEATTRRFIESGALVVVADVQDDRGRRLARSLGPACSYRHVDVSREDDMQRLVADAVDRHGRLDCLFNNAGIAGLDMPIEALQPQSWDAALAVLLRSVYLGMHFAAPVMKAQRRGCIISTAGIAGLQAGHASHVVSAANAAVIQLTRSAAMELGESGVRVNCVCPGAVATPLFGKAAGLSPEDADTALPMARAWLADHLSLPRAGQPQDVAEAVLWLAGEAAGFVNGLALPVDGGLSVGRAWTPSRRAWIALEEKLARFAASEARLQPWRSI